MTWSDVIDPPPADQCPTHSTDWCPVSRAGYERSDWLLFAMGT